jgi:3-oxoacyl-[acyl-carrier-protein] synthase-1
VVGGVDSLCLTTLYGFRRWSCCRDICRPWDAGRAACPSARRRLCAAGTRSHGERWPWLLGCGESSDGHHMSSPHPEGAGAAHGHAAGARLRPGCGPPTVDYVNLHGTGTPGNDAAEDRAVRPSSAKPWPCSSTKGHTGHTLGAAGGVEASIAMLALQQFVPGPVRAERAPSTRRCTSTTCCSRASAPLRAVASNSFGFGGSNCCLVFGAAA